MELGNRADRHFTFISGIECGTHNVSLMTIHLIARALGVDPGLLLTDDEVRFQAALDSLRSEDVRP
ncbi:MAG: hypothetical protein HMLKMBBP_01692 [Planctomycetes bacterium]|nr:hypothetical protein [Planctomycetota bacterium]